MTKLQPRNARCLCGAVELSISAVNTQVGACHCETCRRWGGGPYFALDCGTEVTIHGEDAVSVFDSSEWAERGFCKQCGSHLFYRLKGSGQTMVAAGLLHHQENLELTREVFVDKRPSFYEFSNDTFTMTEAEVFAKFGGS